MSAFPGTYAFGSATVILPVVNETYSLVETVDSIIATSKADVRELLIVVCACAVAANDSGARAAATHRRFIQTIPFGDAYCFDSDRVSLMSTRWRRGNPGPTVLKLIHLTRR